MAQLKDLQSDHKFWKNLMSKNQKHAPRRESRNFVVNAEATSFDGSQERDTLPESVYRELSDGTKVN